jgi:cytosine/adenosine deaminase-related metal-dependent hydrolase
MDQASSVAEPGDVLIENGCIKEVAPVIKSEEARVIHATDKIVMPGFVDAHRHLWQTQLRAMTADWSLYDYTARIRLNYSSFYTPEDVYLGIYAGLLEALNAGVTTVVDHCHIINSPEHADEAVQAFKSSGIRGVWCYGLFGNLSPASNDNILTIVDPAWRFDDVRRVKKKYFSSPDNCVQMGIAATENEYFPMEMVEKEIRFARSLDVPVISIHAGMGAMSRHVKYITKLAGQGLLGPDLLFVHGASFSDKEIKMLAASGAAVVSTPETELQMGMGFPVFPRIISAGGKAALGIDIISNNSADMFTQMRLALAAHRAMANEILAKKGLMPNRVGLSVEKILKTATIGGAATIGLGDRIGSLEAGKQADIILIRKDSINMFPLNDPLSSVVMSANVGDVDTVMVGGEVVKENGKLVNADLESLRLKIEASRDRIIQKAEERGFKTGENIARNFFPLDFPSAFQMRIAGPLMRIPGLDKIIFKTMLKRAGRKASEN